MARPCFLSLPKQLPTGNQVFKCLDYGRYLIKNNHSELNSFRCVFKTMFSTWALRMSGRGILAFHFKPVAKHQTPLIKRSIVCFTMKVYIHVHGCRLAHLGKHCNSICVAYADPFWPAIRGSNLHIWVLGGIFATSKPSPHSVLSALF